MQSARFVSDVDAALGAEANIKASRLEQPVVHLGSRVSTPLSCRGVAVEEVLDVRSHVVVNKRR